MVFGNALRRSCRNENARLPLANGRTNLQRGYLKYRIAKCSTPVMAAVRERRLAYLTYPAQAGITVTHSRGISPHSAVGAASDRTIPIFFLLLYHHTELFSSELAYFCKNTLKRSHQAKSHAVEPHFIRRSIVLNINTIRSAKYNRNLLIILLAANCRQNSFPCYFALSSRLRRNNDKVELIEHKEDPVFQLFAEKRDLLTSSDVAPRYRGQYLRYGPRATT